MRRFVLCLALCYFILVFFSPFSFAITSLGEVRASLSAFRTFVRFALVWFCLFPLLFGVWEGVKLASCKCALKPPVVCSTDLFKAVVPVLVLLFVALWFILRGDLLYVFPCVILFLCFSVLLVLRLPLFVRFFGLCLFRFVGFLFLLGSGKGCGL